MVRKSTRTAALKAAEKTRRESPRNRRRRSTSKSDDSEEDIPKSKNPQLETRSEKGSSGNESDTDSKKPLKKRTRSMAVNDPDKTNSENKSRGTKPNKKEEQRDDEEEVNEENASKGKSKTRNKSNKDNVNDETQNENVQVTVESLNDNPTNDDELSKNGMETSEIDVNISESIVAEMTCDNQSSEITSEQTTEIVISEHAKTAPSDVDETPADLTQINMGAIDEEELPDAQPSQEIEKPPEKQNEACSLNKEDNNAKRIKLNRLLRDNQTDKEHKNDEHETKKKIILKRLESKPNSVEENNEPSPKEHTEEHTEGDNWGSSYEKSNKEEKSSSRKRITLKRVTVDEVSESDKKENNSLGRSVSLQEGSERRKSVSNDNIVIHERQRRKSSTGSEKAAVASEEKPSKIIKKPTKIIKLVRKLPEEPQEPPPPGEELIKKYKWLPSTTIQNTLDILHLETLQELCPDIQILEEEDVDLEIVIRETKSPEKIKRKTFKELEEEEMENIQAELDAEPEDVEVKENIIAMNRKISIVDDTASKLKPPPSPPRNPVSEILFITNLVRPFTVKQLRELLERTGTIKENGFWTDRIKSKCYVCYDTVDQAESTRNALHGVHWPIGNGKKLIIDYATVEEMENAKNPPVVPKKEKSPEKENKQPDLQEKPDREDTKTIKREWDLGKEDQRRRRSLSRSRERRERKHSRRSYTPEDRHKKRKQEEPVPQKAMEDLFLKTKATPSIYWQPLSPEEIARKQQQRQARLEENKRRLEEIRSSGRGGRDRSGRDRNFRRR